MAVKYVKDFLHDASFGFTGSAGKNPVRPHMRSYVNPVEKFPKLSGEMVGKKETGGKTSGKPVVPPSLPKYGKGGLNKVSKVMGEYKKGELHSGSKKGPVVKNPKQAIAIALSESRRKPMKKAGGGMACD